MQRKSRIIIGIALLIGGLFIFSMPNISSLVAFFGALLVLSGLTVALLGVGKREGREFLKKRGGLQGVVRNLKMEEGLANFWLAVSGGSEEHVPVEAYVGKSMLQEGDVVWVKGSRGKDGIIRTNQIRKVAVEVTTPMGYTAKEQMKHEGEIEFTGTVSGGPYDLYKKGDRRGQITKYKVGLKIQRFDNDGNPLGVLETVFLHTDSYHSLRDGDGVWIRGKWDKFGRVEVKEAKNLSSKAIVKEPKRFGWAKWVVGLIVILIILYVFFNILSYI